MPVPSMLLRARQAVGMTQQQVARRAQTSRTTLSAYEHGRKSPTVDTVVRLLDATGHELVAVRQVRFAERLTSRGRPFVVPDALWRLSLGQAMARVDLPLHLSWSDPSRSVDLADRNERARCYEIVLREGTAEDVQSLVDGALLVDLWSELVLPREIKAAWEPLVTAVLSGAR